MYKLPRGGRPRRRYEDNIRNSGQYGKLWTYTSATTMWTRTCELHLAWRHGNAQVKLRMGIAVWLVAISLTPCLVCLIGEKGSNLCVFDNWQYSP